MVYDMIIVGGGPAGLTAAIYALRARKKILLIEKMVIGGQVAETNLIENYPGFLSITGPELADKMLKQAEHHGLEIVYGDVIEYSLEGEIKKIKTYQEEYECKAVILAMGAVARQLDIASEKEYMGHGVSYCATCDGNFYKNKEVAVVGGGNTSIGDALYLANIVKKVYLIHRRDTFRAEPIRMQKIHELCEGENPKLELITNSGIKDIEGNGKVESIIVENLVDNSTREINVDGVFVAIGRKPDTDHFQGILNLSESGYIITDEEMRTNIEGVYAVGDIREKDLKQIVNACGDGAIAAMDIVEWFNRKK